MSEHRRHHDMTNEELGNAIRGLPRREPRTGLRERVLAHSVAPDLRPRGLARPAFAVAALIVLVLADWLVLRLQDTGIVGGRTSQAVVAQAEPPSRDEAALMRELAASGLPLRLAMRHPAPQPETYFELRHRLLNEADGG